MSNLSHLTSIQTFDKWSPTKPHTVAPLKKEKCNWLFKLLLLLIQKFRDILMLTVLPGQIVKPVNCKHKHTNRTVMMLGRNWAQTLLLWDAYLKCFYICIFVLLHNIGKICPRHTLWYIASKILLIVTFLDQ